jgi:hypothetical protein
MDDTVLPNEDETHFYRQYKYRVFHLGLAEVYHHKADRVLDAKNPGTCKSLTSRRNMPMTATQLAQWESVSVGHCAGQVQFEEECDATSRNWRKHDRGVHGSEPKAASGGERPTSVTARHRAPQRHGASQSVTARHGAPQSTTTRHRDDYRAPQSIAERHRASRVVPIKLHRCDNLESIH